MRHVHRLALSALLLLALALPARASVEGDLRAAHERGQAVFLVVTETGHPHTARAVAVAEAAREAAPATRVVVLDRRQPENAAVVQRFRVLAAPVPLILVVAPNGVVAGGALLRQATPEGLVAMIPTPAKARVLLSMQQKRPTFVVASRRAMPTQSAVFEACNEALRRLEGKATTVVVDLDDKAERAYLAELGVPLDATVPVVVVYNAKAEKTAVFREGVDADALVEAARGTAACCPGGSC